MEPHQWVGMMNLIQRDPFREDIFDRLAAESLDPEGLRKWIEGLKVGRCASKVPSTPPVTGQRGPA